jgi:hypothetical protein
LTILVHDFVLQVLPLPDTQRHVMLNWTLLEAGETMTTPSGVLASYAGNWVMTE